MTAEWSDENNRVNIPLLRKAVQWAEAEAAKGDLGLWEQSVYVAETPRGTTYCPGGWTVYEHLGHPANLDWNGTWACARDALGLTSGQADRLFDGNNTIAAVRRVAEDIAGEAL